MSIHSMPQLEKMIDKAWLVVLYCITVVIRMITGRGDGALPMTLSVLRVPTLILYIKQTGEAVFESSQCPNLLLRGRVVA